jgi:hypothetical protein
VTTYARSTCCQILRRPRAANRRTVHFRKITGPPSRSTVARGGRRYIRAPIGSYAPTDRSSMC